jgi:type IV secretory pathway VirB2 component (pilin)
MTTIGWAHAAVTSQLRHSSPPRGGLQRLRGDLGEGVISVAIAVLIMAFLGAAMWLGFQKMWKSTEATTNEKIEQIGSE